MLAGLGWNLQARRHGRHGTGRAQVPEQIGGLEGHDAGADFVEVELARHFGNLGILFVEQGDQRIDRSVADAHQGETAFLEDLSSTAGHEEALNERRDRLRVAQLSQTERRLLVEQEVLLVGRRGENFHKRRHSSLVPNLDQGANRRQSYRVGAGLDGKLVVDGLDELRNGVDSLHLAQRAGGNHGPVEVVLGEIQGFDEKRFGLFIRESAEGLEVLWLLGFLVQRNHLGQRLLGTLHAHLGKLVQRLLLIAQIAELACPGARIVRIASTPGQDKADRERTDCHKAYFSHLSTSLGKSRNKSLQPASGRSQPPVPQTAGRKL